MLRLGDVDSAQSSVGQRDWHDYVAPAPPLYKMHAKILSREL